MTGDVTSDSDFNKVQSNLKKNLLASLAHSHRALRAQLARMSAPRSRDLMVVALRAQIYVYFALRAQCCALHSAWHSGLNCLVLAEQYQNFYF